MAEIDNFETHLDRMERERQAQAHALKLEQERTKQLKLKGRYRENDAFWFCIGLTIVAVFISGCLFLWWHAVRGPNAGDVQRQQEIQMCYDNGGVWKPDMGDSRDDDFKAEHCDMGDN